MQKHPGGRAWWRKAAHFMVIRKERERDRERQRDRDRERDTAFKGILSMAYFIQLTPTF
jgi:hypothetical protein